MRTPSLMLCFAFLVGCGVPSGKGGPLGAGSAEQITLDLASASIDSLEVSLTPGYYAVRVINLAPAQFYTITAEVENETMPPLSVRPAVTPPAPPPPPLRSDSSAFVSTCADLTTATAKFRLEAQEHAVPSGIMEVRSLIANCRDAAVVAAADRLIDDTRWQRRAPFLVERGQVLTIRVQRHGNPGRRWTHRYQTGSRGEWRRTYGFNFLWYSMSEDQRYFVEEVGAPSQQYIVRGRRSQDHIDFVPSVFYTWMPASRSLRHLAVSPTVGLGFDFKAPVVSVGGSTTFNQNATLSAGLSLHQVQRLSERYSVGQTVNSILGEAELQRSVYRLNPYIAVTLRSLTNPFQQPDGNQ